MPQKGIQMTASQLCSHSLIIFEKSWQSGKVPSDWRKRSITSVFKKGDEDCRSYQPVSLTSVPGKIMVQIILEDTSKLVEDREVVKDSQYKLQLRQGQTVPD